MKMSANNFQIEKLDENNYEVWKILMRSVLIQNELWSYVDGTAKKPADAKDISNWEKADEKALAIIMLSIKPAQVIHVKNCKTSSELWETLKTLYQPRGPSRKVTLFKTLLQTKMSESQTVFDHLKIFFEIVENLSEIGISLEEDILSIMLLSSLPKSFENFVVAIESRDTLPNISTLKTKILEEGQRRTPEEKTSAFDGHEQSYFTRAKNKGKSEMKQFSGKCYVCGKRGHYAASCRQKNQKGFHKDKKQTNSSFALLNSAMLTQSMKNFWIIDSGSTAHMCCDKGMYVLMKEHQEKIELAANNFIKSTGIGNVIIKTKNSNITLRDVLYVPELKSNFISVSKATENGHEVIFKSESVLIKYNEKTVLRAEKRNNLFIFENLSIKNKLFSCIDKNSLSWHNKFGHLNNKSIALLQKENMVRGLKGKISDENIECETCIKGKIKVQSFSTYSEIYSKNVLELVHTDVCGPMRQQSNGGARYFVLFIDDFSRKIFVFFLKQKGEVLEKFKNFKAEVENFTGKRIKSIRSDNGREYVNNDFKVYLENNGIKHQLTAAYTPQQNGVAERVNRTLIEMARCMLIDSKLPESYWAEAISTAVYLRNRAPTKLRKATPEEMWTGVKPNVSHLKPFGSRAIILDKRPNKSKFQSKGIECRLVGYCETSKTYRLCERGSTKIHKSRDVIFLTQQGNMYDSLNNINDYILVESKDEEKEKVNTKKEDFESSEEKESTHEIVQEENHKNPEKKEENKNSKAEKKDALNSSDEEEYIDAEQDLITLEDKSTNQGISDEDDVFEKEAENKDITPQSNRKETRGRSRLIRTGLRGRPKKVRPNLLNVINIDADLENPSTVREALSRKDKEQWRKSMQEEYESLMKNGTWELVDLPKNKYPIKSKWVFNVKRDKEGNIIRYKSRLVAKGCCQKYGIDYHETFSPVVRYSSIRVILALAVEYRLVVHQMDATTAFLNGELAEEVYMMQPEMFIEKNNERKVCKLKKSIYGLKQSGRNWNVKLDNVLRKIGFKQCKSDTCVYIKDIEGEINIIAVYVDDIIIASSQIETLNEIKNSIALEIEVVDKGPIEYFLGMEICQNRLENTITVSQKQFIEKLLTETGMKESKVCKTPLDPGQKFKKCTNCENCVKVDSKMYQSLIGSLLYIAVSTRPDIMNSTSKLSQFNNNPHVEHLAAIKHLLRYLNYTKNYKTIFRKTNEPLRAFADADWGGCEFDRRSYTGFCIIMSGAAVSWESRKQSTVALSTTEAEYMALSAACKEVLFLRNFLKELGCVKMIEGAINLYGDNQGALRLAKNPVYHGKSKHIDIKIHFIREIYNQKQIDLHYVSSHNMLADILTKTLSKSRHAELLKGLGINE